MRVTVIVTLAGALETLPKVLDEFEIGGRIETLQITALSRMPVDSWRLEETRCHSYSRDESPADGGVKN